MPRQRAETVSARFLGKTKVGGEDTAFPNNPASGVVNVEHAVMPTSDSGGEFNWVMRVAILTDRPGWHGRELQRAFRTLRVQSAFASLSDCRLDLEDVQASVSVPGFETQAPDAVLVRSIEAGTFEQVTLRLSVLHALRELGVPVYNDARAIERSVDKAMTTFLLRRHGIPTLPTWVTERESVARGILMREAAHAHELVVNLAAKSSPRCRRLFHRCK